MEIQDNKFDNGMEHINNRLDEILRLMKATNRLGGEKLYDNQDLCIMLNLSKRSLQRYRSLGDLAYMQIGQKTFYLESDVKKFIQKYSNGKIPPIDSVDESITKSP